jgi:hypothetical protein
MEEQEVPLEQVHEDMHHHAHGSGEKWVMGVALSAAILAALAAVASLLSGHHANEAMLSQLQASDQWAYYQAKGIKSSILSSKMELLKSIGKEPADSDREKIAKYTEEQQEISKDAKEKQADSEEHLTRHVVLSRGVTLFQVAISVAAISVLTKRRIFWFIGLAFGTGGTFFLIYSMLMKL